MPPTSAGACTGSSAASRRVCCSSCRAHSSCSALALAYAHFGSVPVAEALFLGVKAAVLAIVIEALLRVAKQGTASHGRLGHRRRCLCRHLLSGSPVSRRRDRGGRHRLCRAVAAPRRCRRPPMRASRPPRPCAPSPSGWPFGCSRLLAVAAFFGADHVLTELAWLFSKLAVVTFGGAYAVLAYLAQEVVETYRLAEARRDAGRTGPRRDDAGSAHPRHGIRRHAGRLPPRRRRSRSSWAFSARS